MRTSGGRARVTSPLKKLRSVGCERAGGGAGGGAPRARLAAAARGSEGDAARAASRFATLLRVPHSYFFFCAFSAALVILPVVTSLKFTL